MFPGVGRVINDVASSAEIARVGDVLQAGQRAASNLFGLTDDSLQLSPVFC